MESNQTQVSDIHQQPAIRWARILGGWSLFGLFMALEAYLLEGQSGRAVSLRLIFVREMIYAYVWAGLTPVVLHLVRRFRIERSRLTRTVAIHTGASILIAVVHKALFGILFGSYRILFESVPFSWVAQLRNLLAFVDYGVLLYWMILVIDYAFEYYRQYRKKEIQASRLEAQLAKAQLQALKMQLHPHFLFNTLNAISVLIQKSPDMAQKMLGQLSNLLRLTLDQDGEQLVSLKTELDFLDHYLQIERTRFGERLTVRLQVDPEALDAEVPTMILQPLVENAIRHGVNEQRGPAVITVSARRINGSLRLEVQDNGKGLSEDGNGRAGIGLSNTHARLHQLYGQDHRLELVNAPGGGIIATVDIPYRGQASS
jgi:two-component system LytT family sensor kinase